MITPIQTQKSIPPTKPQPPSEERLKLLIDNGASDIAENLIKEYGLKLRIENGELKDALEGTELWLKRFITVNPDMLAMKEDVKKMAKCNDEVLITGETGTGKELIARAMIGNRLGKFVAVNCAGLPEQLVESELFGHVKGSFTGAESAKTGMMSAANDGVLFLDESGELSMAVQAKLLRALQDKKVRRVGGNVEEDINCKFVCATHRNIKTMVAEGKFREDLYARISTLELHISPLRERMEDIYPIIKSMQGGTEFLDAVKGTTMQNIDLSLNVRSLQKMVKRFMILGRVILQ